MYTTNEIDMPDVEHISHEELTASNPIQCQRCDNMIETGQKYTRTVQRIDGEEQTFVRHEANRCICNACGHYLDENYMCTAPLSVAD